MSSSPRVCTHMIRKRTERDASVYSDRGMSTVPIDASSVPGFLLLLAFVVFSEFTTFNSAITTALITRLVSKHIY